MSKALRAAAIAAMTFVHFKNPADNTRMYVTNENKPTGCSDGPDGFARDPSGNKLPIGVRVYGPGSVEYRKAEDKINDENLKLGKKGLSGARLRQNQTTLLARTTSEFVNFGYSLTGRDEDEIVVTPSTPFEQRLAVCGALYDDGDYAFARDQVSEVQGDLGNFSLNTAGA
jgi:hypothetical protein